nr:hypothetical protein [Tanacetum cinerariifolium]
MARLAFCDYHNMIAILEKYEHNTDFHQIVDFVEASHLRYALTLNPTVYVSHIRQFWSTARIETTDEGTKIVATVDGRIVPLFPSMLVTMGEGSGTPTEPHHTPTPEETPSPLHELLSSLLLPVTTKPLPTVIPSDTPPLKQYTRRTRIAQSSVLPPVADEHASPLGDDSQGKACRTDSGFKADQNRANITKTSTLPSDSTPRVTSLAADEGNMQHKLTELTDLYTRLQRQQAEMASKINAQELEISQLKARVMLLEDKDGAGIAQSGEDAPIKGRSLDEGEEAAIERMMWFPLLVLFLPLLLWLLPTQEEKEKKRWDAEIARIYAEEELQMMIDGLDRNNETVAKYLQEYHQFAVELPIGRRIELISDLVKYQENHAKVLKFQTQQRKPLSRKQQREFYMSVLRSHAGERFKRKGLRLEQDSAKKVKISEEVPKENLKEMMQLNPVEEVYVEALQVKHPIIDWELWALVKETLNIMPAASDKEKELWVELKRLYEPYVKDQLWTHTQNLMHAPVEWKLYDTCGVHHVISKDQEMFMLVEKDYPLRKGLAIVMISYKLQVENYSQMANDLIQKIHKIASSPRQQDD